MDKKTIREIAISSAMYSIGAIFAPLILIGGAGYFLDKWLDTYPLIFLISALVAFVVTNIMLFKRVKKINKIIDKYREEIIADKMDEAGSQPELKED